MDTARERIDWRRIEKLYGKPKSVAVRELFYEACPGYSGPEGWSLLNKPIRLEDAAETIATVYGLVITGEDGFEKRPDYRRDELIVPRFDQDNPRTYLFGRLMLRFLDDPDTPLIVTYRFGKGDVETGTYHCVVDTAEVGGHPLTDAQLEWLNRFWDEAEAWYERKRILN